MIKVDNKKVGTFAADFDQVVSFGNNLGHNFWTKKVKLETFMTEIVEVQPCRNV